MIESCQGIKIWRGETGVNMFAFRVQQHLLVTCLGYNMDVKIMVVVETGDIRCLG